MMAAKSIVDVAKAPIIAYNDKDWDAARASFAPRVVYDEVGTQRRIEGWHSAKDPRGGDRFKRISSGDGSGSPERGLRAHVRGKCGDPNCGPERAAPKEQSRDSDPCRCPYRRDLLGDKCEPEPQSCSHDICHGHNQARHNQPTKVTDLC